MTTDSRTGVVVRLRWSFLVLLAGMMYLGWFLGEAAHEFYGVPGPDGSSGYAVVFTGLLLVTMIAHEAGHALVGAAVGHRLERVTVAMTPSVRLFGEPRDWRRVAISIAGLGAEAGVGWALLSTAPWGIEGVLTSPVALAGLFAIINAGLAVALPVASNGDGRKIYRGIGQMVRRSLSRLLHTVD